VTLISVLFAVYKFPLCMYVCKVEHVQLGQLLKVGNFCRPNVERPFDFVASMYGAKATRPTLSTFDKVDGVKFVK